MRSPLSILLQLLDQSLVDDLRREHPRVCDLESEPDLPWLQAVGSTTARRLRLVGRSVQKTAESFVERDAFPRRQSLHLAAGCRVEAHGHPEIACHVETLQR
jgi:hypothetical protein